MAATINTTEFLFDAARSAYSTLQRVKGQRPLAVLAFLQAEEADRDTVVEEWGAGFVRRGLREAAVYFNGKDDEETANVFWTLRDSIDEDGFVEFNDESAMDDES